MLFRFLFREEFASQGPENKWENQHGEDSFSKRRFASSFARPRRRAPCASQGRPKGQAEDEESVVFVQVKGRDGRVEGFGFDEATMHRDDFERMSMSYLAENPEICDCPVRFDVVAITVVGEARAMIRHRINAMSYGLSEE